MNLQGFIKKTNTKEGTGKRGKWVLYSFIAELDNGTESEWISAGFDKPPFAEGSYGSFDVQKEDKYTNYVVGSWKSLPIPSREPKAAPASSTPPTPRADNYVSTQDSIVYQSSRKDALVLVGLLLEHDALPMSASAAKAGIAKRFEEITAFVDKLTVQYVRDVQTGRVLQSVVDAGAESASEASGAANNGGDPQDND